MAVVDKLVIFILCFIVGNVYFSSSSSIYHSLQHSLFKVYQFSKHLVPEKSLVRIHVTETHIFKETLKKEGKKILLSSLNWSGLKGRASYGVGLLILPRRQ